MLLATCDVNKDRHSAMVSCVSMAILKWDERSAMQHCALMLNLWFRLSYLENRATSEDSSLRNIVKLQNYVDIIQKKFFFNV